MVQLDRKVRLMPRLLLGQGRALSSYTLTSVTSQVSSRALLPARGKCKSLDERHLMRPHTHPMQVQDLLISHKEKQRK